MLHPRHDVLDTPEDLQGLALSLLTVEGRPKRAASGAGAWTATRVPVGWRPRGVPLHLLISVLRPGSSLAVVDQRRVEFGGHVATVVSSMLVPRRVGTSLVSVGPVRWLATGRNLDGSSIPFLGRDLGIKDDRDRPMAGLVARLGLCRRLPMVVGFVALRGHTGTRPRRTRDFFWGWPPCQIPRRAERGPVQVILHSSRRLVLVRAMMLLFSHILQ
jgi:hypothetical protein